MVCTYNPLSYCNNYLWDVVGHNHHTTTSSTVQGCGLLAQPYCILVTILLQSYNVVARLLQP